jgi:V8-like Glu-specific endopeptidase
MPPGRRYIASGQDEREWSTNVTSMLRSVARSNAPLRSAANVTVRLTAALLLSIAPASAQDASAVPLLRDMTSYNCAAATANAAAALRHIGQVIQGRYYEWHEIDVQSDGRQRLACVSILRPTPQQLSASEAAIFLTRSMAIGAPAATARETNQSVDSIEPDNVQPEPTKRVRQTPVSNSGVEQKSNVSDLPPVPAAKSLTDPSATIPTKPAKERSGAMAPEAPPALAFEQPKTVGVDDRTQITTTQVFPWTTLAYLSTTYPNGDSFRCSAVVVSPYTVLTAGHCVHNRERGGYITSARVYPGQSQTGTNTPVRPYGVKSDASEIQTTAQWTQISGEDSYVISDYRHDFAAIQFATAFTHTSTFMPVLYSNTGTPITSAGYPAEIGNSTSFGLYAQTGTETNQSFSSLRQFHVREFVIDGSGGNSGGPFIYVDPGTNQRYLIGLLSYGNDLDDQAGGPWYDSWNQSLVSGWVSWTPNSATTAPVTGLRVPSVFSSALPNVIPFLRFYNAGTTSGTVDVTIADYATGNSLATWTSPAIAGKRTRQFSIAEIENAASATFTKPVMYSLSIRPTFTGNFQSTLWNTGSASLSNTSTCDTASTDQKTLLYLHSSLLAPYTSTIVVHNTGTAAISPRLGIYNAETGQRLTGYTTNVIPANGQIILEVGSLEQAAGITPSTNAYHYNIVAETAFTGYMQQFLNNQNAKMIVDMTASCAMAP